MDFKNLFFDSPEKKLEKAYTYMDDGKYKKARSTLNSHLKKESGDVEFMLALFVCNAEDGKTARARKLVPRIIKNNPDFEQELISSFKSLQKDRKRVISYVLKLSEHHLKQHNLEKAKQLIEIVDEKEVKRKIDGSKDRLRRIKNGISSRKDILFLYQFALMKEQIEDFKGALKIYRSIAEEETIEIDYIKKRIDKILKGEQNLSYLRKDFGDLLVEINDLKGGLKEYASFLKPNPSKAQDLIPELEKLSAREEDTPKIQALLVNAYEKSGNINNALDSLKELADKHLEAAIERLVELRREHSDNKELSLVLAEMYGRNEEISKAVRALTKARKCGAEFSKIQKKAGEIEENAPDNIKLNEFLGNIYLKEEDFSKAIKHLDKLKGEAEKRFQIISKLTKILNEEYDNIPAHFLLAEVCLKEGKKNRSAILLRHILKLKPESAERVLKIIPEEKESDQMRLAAAEAYFYQNQFNRSLREIKELWSVNPDYLKRSLHQIVKIVKERPDVFETADGILQNQKAIPAVNFSRGEIACYAERYDEAIELLKKVLKSNPDKIDTVRGLLEEEMEKAPENSALQIGLIDIYFEQKLYECVSPLLEKLTRENPEHSAYVLKRYKELLKREPEDVELLKGTAEAYLIDGHPRKAIKTAKKALKKIADNPPADLYFLLGKAFEELKQYEASVKNFYNAFKISKEMAEQVLKRLQKIKSTVPELEVNFVFVGRILAELERFSEGLENYREFASKLPESESRILKELEAHYSSHKPYLLLSAEVSLENENYERAKNYLGKIPSGSRDLNLKAVNLYEHIIEQRPSDAGAYFGLGKSCYALERYRKAVEHFRKALKLDRELSGKILDLARDMVDRFPDLIPAYFLMSDIFVHARSPSSALNVIENIPDDISCPDEALKKDLSRIAKAGDGNFDILIRVAKLFREAGLTEKSIEFYRKAFNHKASDPSRIAGHLTTFVNTSEDPEIYLLRGRNYLKTGNAEKATEDIINAVSLDTSYKERGLELLSEVIELNPDFLKARTTRMDYLREKNDKDKLVDLFDSIEIERFEPSGRIEIKLREGFFYKETGELEKSREIFNTLYETYPDRRDEILKRIHNFTLDGLESRINTLENETIREITREMPSRSFLDKLETETGEVNEKKVKAFKYLITERPALALDMLSKKDDLYLYCCEQTGKIEKSTALIEKRLESLESEQWEDKLSRNYERIILDELDRTSQTLAGELSINIGEKL